MMMLIIFSFSSQPSSDLPNFNWADEIIKKGGHIVGYAMLALSYWYALRMQSGQRWLAWFLALLYAATDELHQSFVPGRYSSVWDVVIFDNFGVVISLWLASAPIKTTRFVIGQPKK